MRHSPSSPASAAWVDKHNASKTSERTLSLLSLLPLNFRPPPGYPGWLCLLPNRTLEVLSLPSAEVRRRLIGRLQELQKRLVRGVGPAHLVVGRTNSFSARL